MDKRASFCFVLFVRNPSDRRHRGVAVEFLLSYSGGNSYSTTIPTSVLLPNKLKLNLQHSPLRNWLSRTSLWRHVPPIIPFRRTVWPVNKNQSINAVNAQFNGWRINNWVVLGCRPKTPEFVPKNSRPPHPCRAAAVQTLIPPLHSRPGSLVRACSQQGTRRYLLYSRSSAKFSHASTEMCPSQHK